MYNFFVNDNEIEDSIIKITGENLKHIKNVLRMKSGEKIFVCNKQTAESYLTEIESIENDLIVCRIIEKNDSTESPIKVTIYQGIPKSDKMEYIIQKAVELGVYRIVPTEMKYCIAKIKDEDKKIHRWQAISEAAAKQSKRNIIPKVERMRTFKQLCEEIKEYDLVILAYENSENINLKDILKEQKKSKNMAIIIGPEGGISQEEAEELTNEGAKSVLIGKRILRTETASIAILSMLMYEFEF